MSNKPLAILIGMGPGLGEALVKRFAQGGYHLAFVGRNAERLAQSEARLRAEGLSVSAHQGDAGDSAQMDQVHADIFAKYGAAEVLFYNAAMIEPARFVTPSGLSQAAYEGAAGWASLGAPASSDYLLQSIKTNVLGAHHAALKLSPAMVKAQRGTILLTGGVLAFGPWIEWGVTSLGKAALRSLGHSLFKELSPHGVNVSTIAIHGTMRANSPYSHDKIAEAYFALHQRPRAEWQPDYHYKLDHEGESDPDA